MLWHIYETSLIVNIARTGQFRKKRRKKKGQQIPNFLCENNSPTILKIAMHRNILN